jgi:hypothetical protein
MARVIWFDLADGSETDMLPPGPDLPIIVRAVDKQESGGKITRVVISYERAGAGDDRP